MIQAGVQVIDTQGLSGVIEEASGSGEEGGDSVILLFRGGQRVRLPAEMLTAQEDGTYRAPFSLVALQSSPPRGAGVVRSWVVPVAQEELSVEKRIIDIARIRVTKSVHQEQRVVDEALWREDVGIERVIVNQVVTGPVAVRQEGDTLIVPLLEEVLVVEKRLLLREELRLTRRRSEVHAPQSITLRTEDVIVERVPVPDQDMQEKAEPSGREPEKERQT